MPQKRAKLFSMLSLMLAAPYAGATGNYEVYWAEHDMKFAGVASGGELIFADTENRNTRWCSITTTRGEPAESVVARLAQAIKESFKWESFDTPRSVDGATLKGLPGGGPQGGNFILAGTETGLCIPKPPTSMSCTYDTGKDEVVLRWVLPDGGYDSIVVLAHYSNYDRAGAWMLPGTASKCVIDRKKHTNLDITDLDLWVVGYKGDLASNAGAIHVNEYSQDERFGIPFTDNVAPNWTAWLMSSDKNAVEFEQGVRERFLFSERHNGITHPATKPFYQVIRTNSANAKAGIWRKFLGLMPGHRYRVSARVSTLETDSSEGDWSFSLHSAYNEPNGSDLAVEQLMGLEALPDGNNGDSAGLVAHYSPELTTNNTWEERSTGRAWRDVVPLPDITLPPKVDTITVWVRLSGMKPSGVSIDWVKLEDLSVVSNAVLPEKVVIRRR